MSKRDYMNRVFYEDRIFGKTSLTEKPFQTGEYENCIFDGCDLSEGNLSGSAFTDCEFRDCNISLAKTTGTSFRDVKFNNCKMLGFHFDDCNEFAVSFECNNCTLDHSSFFKTKIPGTRFRSSRLHEADFSECDLTGSVFDNCDLHQAIFDNTNLEKADLRTAYNYSLDPERNRLKKTKFSLNGLAGLLNKYDIIVEM